MRPERHRVADERGPGRLVSLGLVLDLRHCLGSLQTVSVVRAENHGISGPGSTQLTKERSPTVSIRSRVPLGTTAPTGQTCPESGVWEVVGSPSTTAPIAAGNRMPPYKGKAVTWRLIRYA